MVRTEPKLVRKTPFQARNAERNVRMSNDFNSCAAVHCVHMTHAPPAKSNAYGEQLGQVEPRARNSAVECHVHIVEVTGSIPVAPTILSMAAALLLMVTPALANQDATRFVLSAADRYGIPHNLALAVAKTESGVRCGLVGQRGEVGPLQILPATSRGIGAPVNRRSACAAQTDAGMKHLAKCYKGMGGNWWLTAVCHNAGLNTIGRARFPKQAMRYANRVTGK